MSLVEKYTSCHSMTYAMVDSTETNGKLQSLPELGHALHISAIQKIAHNKQKSTLPQDISPWPIFSYQWLARVTTGLQKLLVIDTSNIWTTKTRPTKGYQLLELVPVGNEKEWHNIGIANYSAPINEGVLIMKTKTGEKWVKNTMSSMSVVTLYKGFILKE